MRDGDLPIGFGRDAGVDPPLGQRSAALRRLGLSQAEVASLHGVALDTVRSWSAGRNRVPQRAWDDLRAYAAEITAARDELLAQWRAAGEPPIDIDAAEAGGPALMAAVEIILASTGPVRLGPSGATRAARAT